MRPAGTPPRRAHDLNGGRAVAISENPARTRLALSPSEAAAALGCSRDFFDEHVLPELRVVRRSRRVFVAVAELERWLAREAALTLESQR
jgi:hypothetical protein